VIGPTAPACTHCDLPVPVGRRRDAGASSAFCCFGCRFAHELARPAAGPEGAAGLPNTLVLRLGLGIFMALNIMVFNWAFYSREVFSSASADGAHEPLAGLFAYLLMFLCTVVVAALGFPLARDALQNTFAPGAGSPYSRVDANLLICIGVGAAYLLSVIRTVQGRGSLYFDTAATVLVIVTLGLYIEAGARRRAATAARELVGELPRAVAVRRDGRTVEVGVAEILVGDEVGIRAGESVVVDGPLIEGSSRVNESSLTGESQPRPVKAGDRVLAGTVNLDGQLWQRAEAVGPERILARVESLLERARQQQPPIQRTVDRVAAAFVPFVVLLALGAFGWQAWQGSATDGLFRALAVLLVSCPCALGLAAPLATWNALRRAARHGILVDSATSLERASRIRLLYFDKTGTLTEPRLGLSAIDTVPGTTVEQALRIAAALEATTLHPVAASLIDAARLRRIEAPEATNATTLPGIGVAGEVDGKAYRLGSARLLEHGGGDVAMPPTLAVEDDDSAQSMDVYLTEGGRALARFRLTEVLREEAVAAIDALRDMGVASAVLTGDRPEAARKLAELLRIEVEGGLLPQDKLRRLEEARARHPEAAVGMVGDGINDAPVLAAADVGMAMGSAADLARQAGNVHLIADSLARVPLLLAIARHALRRVRLNLAFAFGYNSVAITLAVFGLLNPIFAAAAMVLSSLTVGAISRGAGRVEDGRYDAAAVRS